MRENKKNKDASLTVALLRKHYDDEISRLEVKVDNLRGEMEKQSGQIINKLDVVEEGINNKLEAIDVAFRGNSRIGMFEQMRNMRRNIYILFVVVVLLLGFKLWGFSLGEWWNEFKGDHGVKPKTSLVESGMQNSNAK